MQKKQQNKRKILFVTVIGTLFFLVIILPLHVTAEDPTEVSINPGIMTVSAGQPFSLTIMCTPGQPIKSYELSLSFDPSLLQATSVSEGTIFTGYTTFFNPGMIDNTNGTICDVYGLIIGSGNVSNQGSLLSISFTAQLASGTSPITLLDVGITNETNYVPITLTNGAVTLRDYNLTISTEGSGTVTKNPDYSTYPYGDIVQLTATAASGWVFSHWTGDSTGSTNPASITMTENKSITAHFIQTLYTLTVNIDGAGVVMKTPDQPTYTTGQVVTLTAEPSIGWMFTAWTGDLIGSQNPTTITMDSNKTIAAHFQDNQPPEITSLTRTTSTPLDTDPAYGWVNVSAIITDNIAVSTVLLCIHTPLGPWNNVSMTTHTIGTYYYHTPTGFSTPGNYSYSITTQDTTGNTNTTDTQLFTMPPNWDINTDGECMVFDLVLISNHYAETGDNGWIREDVDNNGAIEVLDLVLTSNHYGEPWWT